MASGTKYFREATLAKVRPMTKLATADLYYTVQSTILTAALLLLIILSPGCRKGGLFMKEGTVKRVGRSVDRFREIVLHDKVNLILTYDTVHEVSVEAGENLLAGIMLKVEDGKLTITDENKFKWSRDLDYVINVYVNRDDLQRITYYGAGNIRTTNTLKSEEFILDSWTGIGSINLQLESGYTELIIRMANADFTLLGNSRFTRIYCADHGSMNLGHFISEEIRMDYRSIRDSRIHVTNLINADILYKGNVYYKGHPQINSFYNSTGKLIPLP
jgi:putative autotransporter adhesin-like protein